MLVHAACPNVLKALTVHLARAFCDSGLVPEGDAMVDLNVDLHTTRWSVAEAAEAAGVTPDVVRNWCYRGHLKAAERRRGRPVFLAIDVIRAEKATRERARRVYTMQAA